jgi:hypothetical protein
MRQLAPKIFFVGMLGLLGLTLYAKAVAPSRGAILKDTFHLRDYRVLSSKSGPSRSVGSPSRVENGNVTFDLPGSFESYVESLEDPKWRSIQWPPLGAEQQLVRLDDAVVWRDLTPADEPEWRKRDSLGRPAGKEGKILCFYIVLREGGGEGVPCEDEPASSVGRVWAGLDAYNQALYMRVDSAEVMGSTGNKILDTLAFM